MVEQSLELAAWNGLVILMALYALYHIVQLVRESLPRPIYEEYEVRKGIAVKDGKWVSVTTQPRRFLWFRWSKLISIT